MINNEKLTSVINDMIEDGHVMESGDFCHPDGVYRYKIQKLKQKTTQGKCQT